MKTKIYIVKGIAHKNKMEISVSEKECTETAKSYIWDRVEGHWSKTKRIPKSDLGKLNSIFSSNTLSIGYSVFCLHADIESAKSDIYTQILKLATLQATESNEILEHVSSYNLNEI